VSRVVIITGARAPVAQDLARAVRAAGYDVHLADSVRAFASRALRPRYEVHRLPPPRQAFAGFRRAMVDLIEKTDAARIIPTCEEVFWLAEGARLDGYANRVFAPPGDLLRRLHSKSDFPAFAASLGVAVPKTQVLSGPIDPAALFAPLETLVLKPEFSRFATHTLIGPRPRDLIGVAPTPQARWVAQQRVCGEEICSWAAVHRGRVTAFAAYRPRWRHGQAAAYQIEAISSPALRTITERIAAATGLSGHLSFDAIVANDGATLPIECNPRAVSGLHLFDASQSLGQAVLHDRPCPEPEPGRLRHMGPAMMFLGIPAALRRGRIASLIADWRRSHDVIDRDGVGLVSLACLLDAAGFTVNAVRNARSPAGAATADIEWGGEPMQ
jgi:hypothetical protein